jgi:uncharacterized repeat protein (TIGR01451 family)
MQLDRPWVWYDGEKKRTFWLSLSELVVFAKKHSAQIKEEWLELVRDFLPGADLIEANELYARVLLPEALTQDQLNQLLQGTPPRGVEGIAPVFYPSPKLQEAFVLLPEVIVHFATPKSLEEAKQWGESAGFAVKQQLNLGHAFLFSCIGLDCVEKTRQVYEQDSSVRYIYPNWLRPREVRLAVGGNDLGISKTATPEPVTQGQPLTYSITIQNHGPSSVRNIRMTDTLPADTQLAAVTNPKGSCSSTTKVSCTINLLANGETAVITIVVIPTAAGNITNIAQVSAFGDPNPSNNSTSVTTTVLADGGGNPAWNDPLFQDQWYLENTGQGGGTPDADVNITPAWTEGWTGKGFQIAIVDDGLEIKHEDLRANTAFGLHYDFVGNDGDPTAGSHGTSVAGIAAADGNNGIGVVGAAPDADLIGLRLLGANSDTNEAAALDYRPDVVDLSNNSWGPPDTGKILDGPGPLTEAAIADGAKNGRGGKGIVYCWAGGNGGDNDNSNYDGYANLRYTIAVAASTNKGTRAPYSEKGANLLINAPSSGGTLAVTTTDRTGFAGYDFSNYTARFGGTSAASPLTCGALALLLEANPNLSWRDVQFILATTTTQNDPQDPDWTVNGAGYHVNHKYGFGRIDLAKAIEVARSWIPLGEEVVVSATSFPNVPIPDNNPVGVHSSIEIAQNIRIEAVEVVFNAEDHPSWGDLEVRLISPSGTVSVLAERHDSGTNTAHYSNWRFTSKRHLGESSKGTWSLIVRDLAAGNVGTFQSWRLNIYGTAP